MRSIADARHLAVAVLACGAIVATPLQGQQPGRPRQGAIEGTVTDTLGAPLSLAYVRRAGAPSAVLCDDSGRFRLTDVEPGFNVIEVRRLGYVPGTFSVAVPVESALFVVVQLTPVPPVLDPVIVTEERLSPSLVERGFYERLRLRRLGAGAGTFITPEDLAARRPSRVTDALRGISGLEIRNHSDLAVPWGRTGQCIMSVWVDGVQIRDLYQFSAETPAERMGMVWSGPGGRVKGTGIDGFIKPNEVKAIEVYPSGPGTPPQFVALTGTCGAIVIWTRVD